MPSSRSGRIRLVLFLTLFTTYAYFYQGGGWNQNSRFALVRAILNDGTVAIDPYERNTGDKAFFEGHFYSDKAPGLALLAVPVVAPVRAVYVRFGGDPETFEGLALLSYFATVFTVGLAGAAIGVAVFALARELTNSATAALIAALAAGLGTPLWSLSTLFIGHVLSAAGLVLAYWAAHRASRLATAGEHDSGSVLRLRRCGVVIGLAAGWATIAEFPAAIPAVGLAVWYALSVRSLPRSLALRAVSAMAASALLCAGILGIYQYVCFGSPFHLAYSSEAGFEGMQEGLFGISIPRVKALYEVLLGSYRGLLPLSPVLVFVPIGYALARGMKASWRIAAAIAVYYVLLNGSYHYWEGGWSLGPRHLSPALPFLCLALAPAWKHMPTVWRWLQGLALAVSIAISLIGVATLPQPPANVEHPMRDLIWPAFRAGHLALNTATFVHSSADPSNWQHETEPRAAFNLGSKLGLPGLWSLAPLLALWLISSRILATEVRSIDRDTARGNG